MNTIVEIYCYVMGFVTLGGWCWLWWRRDQSRAYERRAEWLRPRFLKLVLRAVSSEEGLEMIYPVWRVKGAQRIMAEVLFRTWAVSFGCDEAALREVMTHYGIEEWVVDRVSQSRGCVRARYLAMLARLPVHGDILERMTPYLKSSAREVRFYALCVQLVADPTGALRRLGEYGERFTLTELAELMALLRRGVLPISYDLLLASPHNNLRSVGMAVVRRFSRRDAEEHLLRMLLTDDLRQIREVLFTLISIRASMLCREVIGSVGRLGDEDRKILLRYMVSLGYGIETLRALFGKEGERYGGHLIQTYKFSL